MMHVIGLMSGTSADGIDAALCAIDGAPPVIHARILHARSFPYAPDFQARLLEAADPDRSSTPMICQLNADVAEHFTRAALDVIAGANLTPAQIDLIGSHGQTIWHAIAPNGRAISTLQIGEASILAERTGITTIANFRPRDIAAGGQGAPLTAYADWLLLRHPTHWRAVQNIGGISNVTFLPPLSDITSPPVAFDTGPGNMMIDQAVALITHGQQTYDRDGSRAGAGRVDEDRVAELLSHPYFDRQPPKTTGRELFGALAGPWIRAQLAAGMHPDDLIATLTMLTAASIADAYQRFAPARIDEVIVGGGGARNPALMAMLRAALESATVLTHEEVGLDSDNKEALAFALLAYETWHHRPGVHPSVTGARRASVLGQITPGDNFAQLIHRTWVKHG